MAEDYEVQQGDCLNSIAFERGFFWQTLWNDGANANLKSQRKDANILKEGDVVHIPDLRQKIEAGATEQRHRFRRKGVPAKFRLRLTEEVLVESAPSSPSPPPSSDEESVQDHLGGSPAKYETKPRRNVPYRLMIDGQAMEGKTDSNGVLTHDIPPNARSGELIVEPGTARETRYPLQLGYLDPLREISGVKQRLANLGYESGDRTDEETEGLAAALEAFQEAYKLPVTGKLDDTTREKLRDAHGA